MNPSDATVTLTGLDGANPLAYLAALGVLRALDHRARLRGRVPPKLSWVDEGHWHPVLHGVPHLDAVIGELLEDKATWSDDPALLLAYDESGEKLLDPRERAGNEATRDLKPRPAGMRQFIDDIAVKAASEHTSTAIVELRRTLDTVAAYGSEFVQDDSKGNTKPTAFHFTAGNQEFLKLVAGLQAGVGETELFEALRGPWLRQSTLPNLGWDATNARLYALRATAPAGDKKTSVAGADWLAFIGLGMLPSFPRGARLMTTGVRGGWKDSNFTWVVWTAPATVRVSAALIRTAKPEALSEVQRRMRGIAAVFTASVVRSDQGGYGSFTPAQMR